MQRIYIYLKTGITFKHFAKEYLILRNEKNQSDLYLFLYNNLNAAKTAFGAQKKR